MLEEILKAIWFIFPAYIANAVPPLICKIKKLRDNNVPIDFGKQWKGKAIFGSGKTWIGLILGVLSGTLFGLIQSNIIVEGLSFTLPKMTIILAFMISLGSLIGDMIGSFIKRRLNLKRGAPAPLLDQLDFIFGAFLFAALVVEINLVYLIILSIITPIIHLSTNRVAYKLGIKKEPW